MPAAGSFRKLVRHLREQEASLSLSIRHVRLLPVTFVGGRAPRPYYYAGVEIGGTVYNVHINAETFKKCIDAGVVNIHEEGK